MLKVKINLFQLRIKVRVGVRVLKAGKVLTLKIEIDFFELLILFKVSFVFRDSLRYRKLADIIYSRNLDNYNEYYAENCRVAEIT